jgi:CRP-like cAMP-binding protein
MAGVVVFAGKLDFLDLGELLQVLGTTSGSGIVQISSSFASQPGIIYIDKGNPINAANGSKSGIDALFSLFGWQDGQFEFIQEEVTCEKVIKKSRMEIILDGLRMLDEGKVEILGPANGESKPSKPVTKSGSLPLINGPLVDYSFIVDEEGFYDGDEIVHEGNHGNWVWVILEGVAEINKQTPKGNLKLLRIGDGAFLGSVAALLKGDNVRSATITADGNVQLGMLDAQLMTSELANCSIEYRELVEGLDERLKRVTNMAVEIYSGSRNLADLIEGKKILIKQGKDVNRLFRIRSGDACVARETDVGIVPIAHLKAGDFFGHLPFVDMGQEPYSASVYASQDLKLSTVDPQALQQDHEKLSSTLQNIIAHLATCISVTTLIATDYYKKSYSNTSK